MMAVEPGDILDGFALVGIVGFVFLFALAVTALVMAHWPGRR